MENKLSYETFGANMLNSYEYSSLTSSDRISLLEKLTHIYETKNLHPLDFDIYLFLYLLFEHNIEIILYNLFLHGNEKNIDYIDASKTEDAILKLKIDIISILRKENYHVKDFISEIGKISFETIDNYKIEIYNRYVSFLKGEYIYYDLPKHKILKMEYLKYYNVERKMACPYGICKHFLDAREANCFDINPKLIHKLKKMGYIIGDKIGEGGSADVFECKLISRLDVKAVIILQGNAGSDTGFKNLIDYDGVCEILGEAKKYPDCFPEIYDCFTLDIPYSASHKYIKDGRIFKFSSIQIIEKAKMTVDELLTIVIKNYPEDVIKVVNAVHNKIISLSRILSKDNKSFTDLKYENIGVFIRNDELAIRFIDLESLDNSDSDFDPDSLQQLLISHFRSLKNNIEISDEPILKMEYLKYRNNKIHKYFDINPELADAIKNLGYKIGDKIGEGSQTDIFECKIISKPKIKAMIILPGDEKSLADRDDMCTKLESIKDYPDCFPKIYDCFTLNIPYSTDDRSFKFNSIQVIEKAEMTVDELLAIVIKHYPDDIIKVVDNIHDKILSMIDILADDGKTFTNLQYKNIGVFIRYSRLAVRFIDFEGFKPLISNTDNAMKLYREFERLNNKIIIS